MKFIAIISVLLLFCCSTNKETSEAQSRSRAKYFREDFIAKFKKLDLPCSVEHNPKTSLQFYWIIILRTRCSLVKHVLEFTASQPIPPISLLCLCTFTELLNLFLYFLWQFFLLPIADYILFDLTLLL